MGNLVAGTVKVMFLIFKGRNFVTEFSITANFKKSPTGFAIINTLIGKLSLEAYIPGCIKKTHFMNIIIIGIVALTQNSVKDWLRGDPGHPLLNF